MTVEQAFEVAAKGWPVFPCGGASGKVPLVRWKDEASRNRRAIRQLWQRHPGANVGIALPEGTVVLDVDDRAAFAATGLALPDGPGQGTPSGGFHRLFSTNGHSAAQTVKSIPGADTRVGGKGYIVAWDARALPAVEGLPEAPLWVLGPSRVRTVNVSFRGADEAIPEGQRDTVLTSLAGSMRDRGMGEQAIYAALAVENEARCIPPLVDRDLRRIARSVGRYEPHNAPEIEPDDAALPAALGLRSMADVERIEPQPLLLDRYQPDGPTVLFGPGGIGKGRLSAQDAAELTRAGGVVLLLDYEDHEQEWRNRLEECGADLARVYRVAPHSPAWTGPRGTIAAHASLVRRVATLVSATFLIIDSAVMALPGLDPSDPRAPQTYFGALQAIGIPSSTLAHVNRAEDLRYPFGSVFWHNLARLSWSMSIDPQGRLVLANRKANDRPFGGRFALLPGIKTKVRGKAVGGFYVMERLHENIGDQIAEALGSDELEVAAIRQRLKDEGIDTKRGSVEAALRRGEEARRFRSDDAKPAKWRIA